MAMRYLEDSNTVSGKELRDSNAVSGTELRDGNAVSGTELRELEEALEKYHAFTEPAMTDARQVGNRIRSVADSIDMDEGKKILKGVRNRVSNEESEGIRILETRDYDRLYNAMADTVQKYFPMGGESRFIHLGNEPKIYEALNESKRESGCTSVDDRVMRSMYNRMAAGFGGYRIRLT